MTAHDFARRLLKAHSDNWQLALLEVADLERESPGHYGRACRLLQCRLSSCTKPLGHRSALTPEALLQAARQAGFEYAGVHPAGFVLRARNVTAAMPLCVDLPTTASEAQALVRWLSWQFDEIATFIWHCSMASSVSLNTGPFATPFLLTVSALTGQECWTYAPELVAPTDSAASKAQLAVPPERRRETLLASDESSFALVDHQLCVVIDQDFLASDCGDDWNESTACVVRRLHRSLTPELERLVSKSFVSQEVV